MLNAMTSPVVDPAKRNSKSSLHPTHVMSRTAVVLMLSFSHVPLYGSRSHRCSCRFPAVTNWYVSVSRRLMSLNIPPQDTTVVSASAFSLATIPPVFRSHTNRRLSSLHPTVTSSLSSWENASPATPWSCSDNRYSISFVSKSHTTTSASRPCSPDAMYRPLGDSTSTEMVSRCPRRNDC